MILEKATLNNFSDWLEEANSIGAEVLIDKDLSWTSFDVVAKLRGLLKIKKIGHAGTLDPLASGLLIVCLGKSTKRISDFQNLPKKYIGFIKLGATTRTDDSEAPEDNIMSVDGLKEDSIFQIFDGFTGKILQVPPIFSAKKINGKALYKIARKHQESEIDIKPVEVEVYSIKPLKIELPYVELEVECSKGTYIRSLARDIGAALGCGGYLAGLRRTAIGDFSVQNALKINEIADYFDNIKKNRLEYENL
ncbi:MAG: tRNA pseudouridine55 synthase [Bacteroidota bacterium]|nr:tRNA pseudouridine55 synthase [Bacteroidota bacterium]